MNRAASRFLALVLLALGLPVRTNGFTASPRAGVLLVMDDFESGKVDASSSLTLRTPIYRVARGKRTSVSTLYDSTSAKAFGTLRFVGMEAYASLAERCT